MKKVKKIIFLLVCLLVTSPVLAQAESNLNEEQNETQFYFEMEDKVDLEKNILGSSLMLGNSVSINNNINGVALIGGSNVEFNSFSEYALIAGSNIDFKGKIEKDILIAGSVIELSQESSIGRDGFIYGTDIIIKGSIERDLVIYGNNVVLEDVYINGNVTINSSTISINDNTEIKGTLKHNDNAEININEATLINNIVKFEAEENKVTFIDTMWKNMISYAGLLLTFLVIFFLTPKTIEKLNKKIDKFELITPFVYCGKGALLMLLIPFVFMLLLISSIGVSLGLILLGIYILMFYLSTMVFGYTLGYILWNRFIKKEKNVLLIGFIGMVIMYILAIIPYINTLVALISSLIGFALIFDIMKERE